MSNIAALPKTPFANDNKGISEHLRNLADAVESGQYSGVKTILCCIDSTDEIFMESFGQRLRATEVLGLLEFAKFQAMDKTDD